MTMADVTFIETVNQRLCRKNPSFWKIFHHTIFKVHIHPKTNAVSFQVSSTEYFNPRIHSHTQKGNKILAQISKAVKQKLYYYI